MKLSERGSEYHKKHPRMHTYLRAHMLEYGYVYNLIYMHIIYIYICIFIHPSLKLSLSLYEVTCSVCECACFVQVVHIARMLLAILTGNDSNAL